MATRRWGAVRKLGSGRYQASYPGPDGVRHTARTEDDRPLTFTSEKKANDWLTRTHVAIQEGRWVAPGAKARPMTLHEYAKTWLDERDLEVRSREHAEQLLRDHINPALGDKPLTGITPALVREWYAKVARATTGKYAKPDRPVARAHAYGTLRSIMQTAVHDELIPANPCHIRGAGRAKTKKKVRPATLPELGVIVAEMPERLRVMVQLAVWCSLRFGELAELRRGDVDLKNEKVWVRRGVVRTRSGRLVKTPKSEAGIDDVTIPPHIIEDLRNHLRDHVGNSPDALLFPASSHGEQLAPSTLYGRASITTKTGKVKPGRGFYGAREVAGRPDLRFHDLRHTGQTYAATTGANLRELMARARQSSPAAALRYIHEVDGRQQEIAQQMSDLAKSNVVPLHTRRAQP